MSGIVYLVGGGPGDPELITLRGVECLRQADVVIYDRLVSQALHSYAPQAEWIDVGKQPDHHPIPQHEINRLLVEKGKEGKVVVRLKGGDPFVFGRGGEEAQALLEAGIPFEVVPGVTSAIAGPAYAGIPVTQRNMACSAAFITGHRAQSGCSPTGDWQRAARGVDTLVFMMGVASLPQIVEQMRLAGRPASTPVALVERATTPLQKVVTGTLENILERAAGVCPPALIVVGDVASLHEELQWFKRDERRPLFGLRVVNTRPRVQRWSGTDEIPGPDEFTMRLYALGAQAISLPSCLITPPLDSAPLDCAIHHLSDPEGLGYNWIIFTSRNAVQFFGDRLFAQGCDARSLSSVRLAAVGPRTAAALRPYGLKADFIPSYAHGKSLAKEMTALSGRVVLVPHAEGSPPLTVPDLLSQGYQVEAVPAYRVCTEIEPPDSLTELIAGEADVVTFFSPAAVRGLTNMLAQQGCDPVRTLNSFTTACVGPTTAQAARTAGLRVDIVAAEQSVEGMCQALAQWVAEKQPALG
ncbi:MAG: uroporphyrinogen-III C-methyltransferase [Chloroflexi bacterium]|jgi:uroporphyrinogen III methyltransferase/synthase|nr:uroporphyrinogen-III C-methyltransferase [Chloroflexota bacterium]